jgi:hypothetical protein
MTTGEGWYPDPEEPTTVRWWDGRAWTSHTAAELPHAPEPPARRRRRVLPVAVAGAVVAIAMVAVVVIVVATQPTLTFDGAEIVEPEGTLTAAEATVADLVDERHGTSNDDTRCYFSLPDDRTTDVNGFLRCGPVLFVDGDPDEAFLAFDVEPRESDDGVRLVAAGEPREPEPSGLDGGEVLRRPDDREPPEDNGGLDVPDPPPADAGLFEVNALEGVDLENPGPDAVIVSLGRSYQLSGLAQPERFGRGDDARTPAEGETFIAAEITVGPGEQVTPTPPDSFIQIDDGDPRPLPDEVQIAVAPIGLLVSVPDDAEVVDLVVTEAGVEQRLSLLTGEPAAQNPSVLRRANRTQILGGSQAMGFTLSKPGFVTENHTVTVTMVGVELLWFLGADGSSHPADPGRAFLVVDVDYAWPAGFGADLGLDTPVWTLTLPDGTVVPASNLADDPVNRVVIGFDVAADFTDGTITLAGRQTFADGVTLDLGAAQFPTTVSIAAG